MMDVIGQKIKDARLKSGLTQNALAEKLGVKTQSIQQWETGETSPRPSRYNKLADALGLKVHELLCLKDESDQANPNHKNDDAYYLELAKEASSIALVKLQQLGWVTIKRTDIPLDAMADIVAHEIAQIQKRT